jgi:hypothetical protein
MGRGRGTRRKDRIWRWDGDEDKATGDWEERTERKPGKSSGEAEDGGKKKRNLVEERESRKCRRV